MTSIEYVDISRQEITPEVRKLLNESFASGFVAGWSLDESELKPQQMDAIIAQAKKYPEPREDFYRRFEHGYYICSSIARARAGQLLGENPPEDQLNRNSIELYIQILPQVETYWAQALRDGREQVLLPQIP